jgi:hypothetical protein
MGQPISLDPSFLLLEDDLCIQRSGTNGAHAASGGLVEVRLTELLAIGAADDERFFRLWFGHRISDVRRIDATKCIRRIQDAREV